MKAISANPTYGLVLALVFLFVLAPVAMVAPAWAQAAAPIDGQVVVPWGDIVAAVFAGGGAVATWALRYVPLQWRANKVLEAALQWAINSTPGIAKGQSVTFKTGSVLLERIVEYFVDMAPMLLKLLGGETAVRKMALARIDFDADVDARPLLAPRGFAVAHA